MSVTATSLRFSPDVCPDRGDVVMLHLLDFISARKRIDELVKLFLDRHARHSRKTRASDSRIKSVVRL